MATDAIQLIVGLGNPGAEYANHRHNAGAWWVQQLADDAHTTLRPETKFHSSIARARLADHECYLTIPSTYMNESGRCIQAIAKFYKLKPQQILVVHDELDLPPGVVRLKYQGGHGGHNGLRDIISALGSKDFYRLRIGIGHPGHKDRVHDYVLHNPSRAHKDLIDTALTQSTHALPLMLEGDMARAMKQLHTK